MPLGGLDAFATTTVTPSRWAGSTIAKDDGVTRFAPFDIGAEAVVDLDDVDQEVETPERGISRSEVIEGDSTPSP